SIVPARRRHLYLDVAELLQRIRITGVVTQNVVVARLGVDPFERLVEVVLVHDRVAAGELGDRPQAVLRFAYVILPVGRVERGLIEVGTADETARIDRVHRHVRAIRFARELRELAGQIGRGEFVPALREGIRV